MLNLPGLTRLPLPATTILLCIFTLIIFQGTGCSVGDFVGAYFNTYYNAQRAFSEAEQELLAQNPPTRMLDSTYLAPFTVPATARTKFTTVIEKGSKLLQYHPNSALVDDALMLIGRSYYYQNDNQQAERKFKELLDQFPGSDLAAEARLLLAQCNYRMKNPREAQVMATQLLDGAAKSDDRASISKAHLLLAALLLDGGDSARAIEQYKLAAEFARTSDDRFLASMRMAMLQQDLLRDSDALKSYENALSSATSYVQEYRATLGMSRMYSRIGKHDESLSLLEDQLAITGNRDVYGEINLEIANIYRDQGDIQAAVDQYVYVDTTFARTEISARSYYQLGLIYEKRFMDYDSALAVYSKGRNEFAQATVTPLLSRKADAFAKYFLHRGELAKNESLKTLILFPPDTTMAGDVLDSALVVDESTPDSLELRQEDAGAIDDSLKLYIQEFGLPDSLSIVEVKKDSISPPRFIPITVPLDTVEARIAFHKSELAALFYDALQVRDSAEHWFHRLLSEHPSSVFVPRSLYTLAQLYTQDSVINTGMVDSLYRVIVENFPESEFADPARKALGLPPVASKREEGEVMYFRAEESLLHGQWQSAITVLSGLLVQHPESPYAPKARYAIGWIYEQQPGFPDSAIAHYRRLVESYPSTEFAARVKPMLALIDQERRASEGGSDSVKVGKSIPAMNPAGGDGQDPPVLPAENPAGEKSKKPEGSLLPPDPKGETPPPEKPKP